MCGIGGVLMFPKERSRDEIEYIRVLVRHLAIENQLRGHDATGVAVFNERGNKVFKQPISAKQMVVTDAYSQFERQMIGNKTKNILIHTRAATKGEPENNDNNHPIESHRYIGVHNGIIWNDDELFKQHNMFRQGEVDSEVIFRLLDIRGTLLTMNKIAEISSAMSGSFTFSFVPKAQRNKLYIVRNDNPVTLTYLPELNIIAFASVGYFLKNAIAATNEWFDEEIVDSVKSVDCVPVMETIYAFDTNADNALEQLRQVPTKFKAKGYSYGGRSWWKKNYKEWYGEDAAEAYYYGEMDDIRFQNEADEEGAVFKDMREAETAAYAQLLDTLSDDEIIAIEEHFAASESRVWSEGFGEGRGSLAQELEQVRSLAFQKGYEKGMSEGFDIAVSLKPEDEPEDEQTIVEAPLALPSGQ
jgi:glucosamine 6-phosphate synthetase-like amidotransferase/phosphosugar isomerase protein